MLIIPLTGKMSLRNPPVVTIALIMTSCLVFLLFQLKEPKQYAAAENFYIESGLADMEVSRYIDYKYTAAQRASMGKFSERMRQEKLNRIYWDMRRDQPFMDMLERGEIITADDPQYHEWTKLREEYSRRLSKVVSIRFGFKPARPSIVTLFTHMFLHGGIGHLVGNMIFLWLVGCLLEMGCGRIYYLATYILTGLCAVGLFWLWNIHSMNPLVGASGAIAGLMGSFAVLYGSKTIKVFYTIGVYFNYVQVRAIILLPLWIGSEVYQLVFSDIRHIAYLAHIGGLLSGALFAFINKRYLGFYKSEAVEPEAKDEISPLLEKALAHIRRLEMKAGVALLHEVLEKDPNHIAALKHLFDIQKMNPEDKQLHDVANRLLSILARDEAMHTMSIEVYQEYIRLVKRAHLSAELYMQLISILAHRGYPEEAERILGMFLKKKPDFPGLPTGLLKLAYGYKVKENFSKHEKYLNILCDRYSNSPEAQLAKRDLSKLPCG